MGEVGGPQGVTADTLQQQLCRNGMTQIEIATQQPTQAMLSSHAATDLASISRDSNGECFL